MKKYKIEVIVSEGSDEFWEGLTEKGETGCEEITKVVREAVTELLFPNVEVRLIEFTDK